VERTRVIAQQPSVEGVIVGDGEHAADEERVIAEADRPPRRTRSSRCNLQQRRLHLRALKVGSLSRPACPPRDR
jgi:hypothetical protein